MRKIILPFAVALLFTSCNSEKKEAATAGDAMVKTSTETASDKPAPAEIADAKYMDMGKQMMSDFAAGNIDAYGEHFADNAVYLYSSGDSMAGKKAIVDYWKNRRATVVESVAMSNDIWLPIKVNQPQRGPDLPGVWLMGWHQVNAKYKNGKSLQFWTHQDMHYNEAGKVDRLIMYIDRGPINAALGAK